MKKIKIFLFSLLAMIAFQTTVIAWDPIGSGGGMSPGGSGSCQSAAGCCFCRWNNKNYGAVQFSIAYYDGNYRYTLGKPIAYYKSSMYSHSDNYLNWVEQRLLGAKEKKWLPFNNLYGTTHSQDLKNTLLNDSQKNADYPRIREIFADAGVNYDQLLAAAKSRGTYTDSVTGMTFTNIINEKIGSKGAATKGIRLIVEPIVTIESTGFCPSFSSIVDKAHTIKNTFAFAYGKKDGSFKYLNNNTLEEFATIMYMDQADAGYYAVSKSNVNLSQVSASNSGWGLNIYGPFDDVDSYCDPDQEYDGYDSGVQYCCKTEKITPTDKTNNKDFNNGGNLTRPLEDYEIETECNKQKCDPDIDGVDTCCVECNVSPDNLSNNVEGECLTKPINPSALENSTCNKGTGGSCEYALDVDTPNTCDTKNTGKITDIASWKCTFSSTNNEKVKDHYFDNSSNSYCAVYCKEDVNYYYPTAGTEVYSGSFMLVGSVTSNFPALSGKLDPISYKGNKTCRVTTAKGSTNGSINKTKFENDMRVIDNQIATYWDEWKIWQAKQTACNNDTNKGTGSHMHCDNNGQNCKSYEHTNYSGGQASYNGVNYTCGYEVGHCKSKPNYSSQIAAAKQKYDDAVAKRKSYINQINACTNFAGDRTYKFQPQIVFEYEEPTYGYYADNTKKKWTLDISESNEETNQTYYTSGNASDGGGSGSNSFNFIENTMYKCSGNTPCTKSETYKYPNVIWWESAIDKEIKYTLPESTYQYISKSTAQSFDSKSEAGGDNAVDMGIANLPIHVSTMAGKYNFKLTTVSLGEGNKFNKYVIENNKFNDVQYGNMSDYTCNFKVKCEKHLITTDPDKYCEICEDEVNTCNCEGDDCKGTSAKDINLIFRTISLNDRDQAFPGITGEGRPAGDNWPEESIEGIIVNNRGVESYEVYKQSPMYEITLTPNLMKEIRKYNKQKNGEIITIYDGRTSTTGIAGYADYSSMICQGNGTKCISTAIRNWGVSGCGVSGYSTSKYNKCNVAIDKAWGD